MVRGLLAGLLLLSGLLFIAVALSTTRLAGVSSRSWELGTKGQHHDVGTTPDKEQHKRRRRRRKRTIRLVLHHQRGRRGDRKKKQVQNQSALAPTARSLPSFQPPPKRAEPDLQPTPGTAQPSYVIFSTDCAEFQNWQSVLLTHSAAAVGQESRIVRLISGCASVAEKETARRATPEPAIAFFAPKLPLELADYRWANRPFAIRTWLRSLPQGALREGTVAILDPDMVFVNPLVMPNVVATRDDPNFLFTDGSNARNQKFASFAVAQAQTPSSHPRLRPPPHTAHGLCARVDHVLCPCSGVHPSRGGLGATAMDR
jgi:hypothetical protein